MFGSADSDIAEPSHHVRRCDACATPARVFVLLTSGGGMAFCEQHARRYYDTLRPRAVVIEPLPGVDRPMRTLST
ncbi:DUF7455 domain-containing protein [Actinophytocola sp.]|jgi:hypothetical protein|uniref:DUF7455 domain-containing protein n=1 Tax=Actinophytocola sp. TaxID=1872138 RepID=UPI003BB89311